VKLTFSLLLVLIVTLLSAALVRRHPQTVKSTNDLEVELVTLRASGFEPAQVTRPKGPFVLFIEDRSGKEHSSFTLQQVAGEHLRQVNTTRTKFESYEVVDLPLGDYLLTNANTDSICRFTIMP
jgi:hypothetical protein